MHINPDEIPHISVYKLITGSIVPRPIAWVSTVNPDGHPNLAPFSYFNAVCPKPPMLTFCPSVRGTDGRQKDTLYNVRATGEFVVNVVTDATAEAMNLTAQELPAEANEFEIAGLTPIPSILVKPPRVGESPIHFECKVHQIIEISDQPGGGNIVIGRIVQIHVQDDLLIGADKIDTEKLRPVGRLGGPNYCHVHDIFSMIRPPSQIKRVE